MQGVWFRASTKRKAEELGLTGFVQNQRDGSVYCEASGPAEAIAHFISWCNQGPELARVDRVQVADIKGDSWTDFYVLK